VKQALPKRTAELIGPNKELLSEIAERVRTKVEHEHLYRPYQVWNKP
jgi:hypothetical protein